MPLTMTTELEAVNTILGAVGESPIASLDDSFVDAELARDCLVTEMRSCQALGWTFNTDKDVVLTPTLGHEILVPSNVLRLIYANDPDIIVRGSKLYNRSTQTTDGFTDALTITKIVYLLDFDEMPQPMRDYVTIAAARKFQDQYQGDTAIHKFKEMDELRAKTALLNYEAEIANWNVLSESSVMQRIRQNR